MRPDAAALAPTVGCTIEPACDMGGGAGCLGGRNDSMRRPAYADGGTRAFSFANSDAHAEPHADAYTSVYAYANGDPDSYANGDSDSDTNGHPYTHPPRHDRSAFVRDTAMVWKSARLLPSRSRFLSCRHMVSERPFWQCGSPSAMAR